MGKGVKVIRNRKLEREIETLLNSNMTLKVGILGDPDSKATKAKAKRKKSPMSNLEVGIIHEFGAPKINIPQRSFLRSTFDDEKKGLNKKAIALIKRHIAKGGDPKTKIESALSALGVWFVGRVKNKFRNNNWDPLKNPSKRRRGKVKKGFIGPPRAPKPLIDSGQLRASIGYEVKSDN